MPRHVVDLDAEELHSAAGQHVDLRPRSFAVLRLLAENAGHLVSKDHIISAIWGDVVVTEDSLIRCVADIRKAIGGDDRRFLRTIPRMATFWSRPNATLSYLAACQAYQRSR